MSLTFGFYDSNNHDRKYNALQMSSIFDGIIEDGIFMTIGDRFAVTGNGEDMFVTVGTGRAWFNHTWTLNDALLLVEIPQSELILNRYDAVVLEVNSEVGVRENFIKVLKGTPSSNPVYPTLVNTKTVHQHVLAYIYVEKNATSIRQADITSMIGKGDTPYVTCPLGTIDIEDMVAQWEDQWKKFFEQQTKDMGDANEAWKEQWETWFNEYVQEMDASADKWKDLWHQWYHMYTDSSSEEFGNWKNQQKEEFIAWFEDLQAMLNDQVAAMLAAEIEELKKRTTSLEKFESDLTKDKTIYGKILDSNGDPITDSMGDPILSRILFDGSGYGGQEVYIGDTEPEIKYPIWINPSGSSPASGSDSFLVSDAFSGVKNYSKGDYCIHSNTLYKFITSKDPGEWDPSVVEATNVGNEFRGINDKFKNKTQLLNIRSYTLGTNIDVMPSTTGYVGIAFPLYGSINSLKYRPVLITVDVNSRIAKITHMVDSTTGAMVSSGTFDLDLVLIPNM